MRELGVSKAWHLVRRLWHPGANDASLDEELTTLRQKVPAPVFWLFGKTQSGKTSLIRYLTGAEDAVIGNGFRPCTRTSRKFPFPNVEVPVMTFLDTRGVDEPGYNPTEDLAAIDPQAHLMVVTLRITDFAQGSLRSSLETIRKANPGRPVILVLTCLHEVSAGMIHPQPYPFDITKVDDLGMPDASSSAPPDWVRLVKEQAEQFKGLVDRIVPVDLTRAEEGFPEPNYGGEALKRVILDSLPGAIRSTFARHEDVTKSLKDLHLKHAMPIILGYSSMAATAGAIPIPFIDLVLLPAIQARMVRDLGKLYGQPMTATRFLEFATSLGMGLLARQAMREVVKFIPFVGSAAGAALAWASTFALGRAFCEYYQTVHQGHLPNPETLKRLYREQLTAAEREWFRTA